MEDTYSTSNIVSIWYENNATNGDFEQQNNSGFQLSYASVGRFLYINTYINSQLYILDQISDF